MNKKITLEGSLGKLTSSLLLISWFCLAGQWIYLPSGLSLFASASCEAYRRNLHYSKFKRKFIYRILAEAFFYLALALASGAFLVRAFD